MTNNSPFRSYASGASSQTDFLDNLNEAIKQNPVPSLLIGAGVLWLFFGGAKNTALGGAAGSIFSGLGKGAQAAGGTAYSGVQSIGGAISAGVSGITQTAADLGSHAVGAVQSAAGTLGNAASDVVDQVSDAAKAAYGAGGAVANSASQTLSKASPELPNAFDSRSINNKLQPLTDLFSQNPLLLGAVGIAAGAAFAAAMRTSELENRLMGERADSVKDTAGEMWNETTKKAGTMVSVGLEEARAQGLTPEVAGQALRTATEKVSGVVDKAKDRLVDRLQEHKSERTKPH